MAIVAQQSTVHPKTIHRQITAAAPAALWQLCSKVWQSQAMRLVFVLALCCPLPLFAQEQILSQMVHTSWTGVNGAPQAIRAIAQTPDGFLWVASVKGLYTFDGLSFSPFQPGPGSPPLPATSFHYLFVSRRGDLWAFPYHGPPRQIHDGQVVTYDRADRDTIEVMGFPQQDSMNTLWAVLNERALVKLGRDGIWHQVADPGQGHGHMTMLFIDSADTMWVVIDDLLYRRPLNGEHFDATPLHVYGWARMREGPQHDFWIMGTGPATSTAPSLPLQHVDSLGRPLSKPPTLHAGLANLLPAMDGSLWGLTVDNVLAHIFTAPTVPAPGVPVHRKEREPAEEAGSNGDAIALTAGAEKMGDQAFMTGTDGSLWIGGLGGLEHFARATLVPALVHSQVGGWTSCIDAAGTLWAASPSGELLHAEHGKLQPVAGWSHVEPLFCSGNGQVALADASGIATLRGGTFHHLPLLPGFKGYGNHYVFTGVTQTAEGTIIAAAAGGAIGRSLWTYRGEKWERFLSTHGLLEVSSMLQQGNGPLFLGFRGSEIGILDGGAFRKVSTGQPGVGSTLSLANTSYGIFACGTGGIAFRAGDAFRMLPFEQPDQATSVTGLVEAANGDLWFNGSLGVVRVAAAEVKEAIAHPDHKIGSINIQEGNFVGPSLPFLFSSTVNKDPQGRLWFSTLNGVVSVTPELLKPSVAPMVSIQSILADGRPLTDDATFSPGVNTLRIAYAGIDLLRPREVHYRYQLIGFDKGWQDVGTSREAAWTHLRPGEYTFQVMASNGFGVWSQPHSSISFVILPHFYQTAWFATACALLFASFLWLGIRTRVAFISAGIRVRAEERAEERIRIARDLHDTLLQGVQGLLLTFHAAAERVPSDHESKRSLDRALATADKIIIEGRDRVKGLRSVYLTDKELPPAIEAVASDLNAIRTVRFAMDCPVHDRVLEQHVASEVFLIAREAIINAFSHAQPSQITVRLRYGKHRFTMSVADDGEGFDAHTLEKAESSGHWGIQGMVERAEKLGATVICDSFPKAGTTIRFALKGRRAYE